MTKKVVIFRLLTWGIGAILALISGVVFFNENELMWSITRYYNEIVCILSFIPIAQIMLVIDMIRGKGRIMNHMLTMAILLICFFIYICVWIACTGGV